MPGFRRKDKNAFRGGGFSIGRILGAPFRAILGWLSGPDSQLGQNVSLPRRIWTVLVQLVVFPFWLLVQLLKFIVLSWTTTRDGAAAMWGLVPLLLIFLVTGVVFASGFVEDRLTKSMHRRKVLEAEEVEDYEKAIMYSRRVQNINPAATWKFIHGLTLFRAGMQENGLALIRELAIMDESGHLPAHLFVAKELMNISPDDPQYEDELETARQHLAWVVSKTADDDDAIGVDARQLLPRILFEQAQLADNEEDRDRLMKEAIEGFENVALVAPEVIPKLVRYLLENDEVEQANLQVGRGLEKLLALAERSPNRPEIWTVISEIWMVSDRHDKYNQAVAYLDRGLPKVTEQLVRDHIRRLQANALVELSKSQSDPDSPDALQRKLTPICSALQIYPRNPLAMNEFIDLVVYPPNPDYAGWLETIARDEASPALYHIINGILDSVNGKPATGSKHFRLAMNGDARAGVIVNDLASTLCKEKNRCVDALRIIDVAIDTWSSAATLIQTRGEILLSLGRPAEALPELEFATDRLGNDPRAFSALADCYEELGRDDQAANARQKSRSLEEEIDRRMAEIRKRIERGS
jgi:tetratricopeptide (TPR) repeat protein